MPILQKNYTNSSKKSNILFKKVKKYMISTEKKN